MIRVSALWEVPTEGLLIDCNDELQKSYTATSILAQDQTNTDILLPKCKLDVLKRSFYYHGASIFNKLPANIKVLPPKERFSAITAFYS